MGPATMAHTPLHPQYNECVNGKGGFALLICIHLYLQPHNSQRFTTESPTMCAEVTLLTAHHTP